MNLIMRGIHAAIEPFRYRAPLIKRDTHSTNGSSGANGLISSFKHRRRVNRAIHELSRLSNATLKDIGVERGNIPQLVEAMMKNPVNSLKNRESGEHKNAAVNYRVRGGATA